MSSYHRKKYKQSDLNLKMSVDDVWLNEPCELRE